MRRRSRTRPSRRAPSPTVAIGRPLYYPCILLDWAPPLRALPEALQVRLIHLAADLPRLERLAEPRRARVLQIRLPLRFRRYIGVLVPILGRCVRLCLWPLFLPDSGFGFSLWGLRGLSRGPDFRGWLRACRREEEPPA